MKYIVIKRQVLRCTTILPIPFYFLIVSYFGFYKTINLYVLQDTKPLSFFFFLFFYSITCNLSINEKMGSFNMKSVLLLLLGFFLLLFIFFIYSCYEWYFWLFACFLKIPIWSDMRWLKKIIIFSFMCTCMYMNCDTQKTKSIKRSFLNSYYMNFNMK